MAEKIRLLGIAGSLRKESYNKALLRAATEIVPEDAELEIFDLEGIPPFNQDHDMNPPERVTQFKERIRAADAILIASPEYNYSIPGVLKNAIDWASRPYGDSAWEGKPVAVMSASPWMLGGARAQYHLRQCFIFLNMIPPSTVRKSWSHAGGRQGRCGREAKRSEVAGEDWGIAARPGVDVPVQGRALSSRYVVALSRRRINSASSMTSMPISWLS